MRDEPERQRGLAAAGSAGDEYAALAGHQRGGVQVVCGQSAQLSAGRATMKRAPLMSPGLVPGMFSAVSVPPCASTIWRLIEGPRPEFWPNASLAGRSV